MHDAADLFVNWGMTGVALVAIAVAMFVGYVVDVLRYRRTQRRSAEHIAAEASLLILRAREQQQQPATLDDEVVKPSTKTLVMYRGEPL